MAFGRDGRPHSLETKLGVLMAKKQVFAYVMGPVVGINPRRLTELLAGRKPLRPEEVQRIAKYLRVDPSEITEDTPDENPGQAPSPDRLRNIEGQIRRSINAG